MKFNTRIVLFQSLISFKNGDSLGGGRYNYRKKSFDLKCPNGCSWLLELLNICYRVHSTVVTRISILTLKRGIAASLMDFGTKKPVMKLRQDCNIWVTSCVSQLISIRPNVHTFVIVLYLYNNLMLSKRI